MTSSCQVSTTYSLRISHASQVCLAMGKQNENLQCCISRLTFAWTPRMPTIPPTNTQSQRHNIIDQETGTLGETMQGFNFLVPRPYTSHIPKASQGAPFGFTFPPASTDGLSQGRPPVMNLELFLVKLTVSAG